MLNDKHAQMEDQSCNEEITKQCGAYSSSAGSRKLFRDTSVYVATLMRSAQTHVLVLQELRPSTQHFIFEASNQHLFKRKKVGAMERQLA